MADTYMDRRSCSWSRTRSSYCNLRSNFALRLVCHQTSGLVLSDINRRSLFYAAAVVTAVAAFLCLGMQESRPSKLMRDEVRTVARKTSFDRLSVNEDDGTPDANTFVRTTLVMPIKLFLTEPIVFFTSMMAATVYGVTYLFVSSIILTAWNSNLTSNPDRSLHSDLHRPFRPFTTRNVSRIPRHRSRRSLHPPSENLRHQTSQKASSTKCYPRTRRQAFRILRRSSSPGDRTLVVRTHSSAISKRNISLAVHRLITSIWFLGCGIRQRTVRLPVRYICRLFCLSECSGCISASYIIRHVSSFRTADVQWAWA